MGSKETETFDAFEMALELQQMLVNYATGGKADPATYVRYRRELLGWPDTRRLLPEFVRSCRTLDDFWPWIKAQSPHYAPRRVLIKAAFHPLLDALEEDDSSPADDVISSALENFDAEGVHAAWVKALERRKSDPEGAITTARTLLETVCKRILEEWHVSHTDADDLPKLYGMTAEALTLAPNQHTEPVFKSILGSCHNVVNSLGTLRNRIGDAHGKGRPVKVSPRHANLAVNLGGTVATFLVETHVERKARIDEIANEVRSKLLISEIVKGRVELVKAGREWKGLSPFTIETVPSFYVNDEKGFYHCFSTGKHGDVVMFLMETEGLSFSQSVMRLAAEVGITA